MFQKIHSLTIIAVALAVAATGVSAQTIFQDGFELCRTAGVVEWDGGGDGVSWSDPANWVGDMLPADGDAVAIRLPASVTVEYHTLTTTLSCLGVTSNLLVSSGSLVLDGPATIMASLAITGGAVAANAQMSVVGTVDLGNGTLEGSGTVTVNGKFTWTGGLQRGTGETVANGGLLISGDNGKDLRERTLNLNAASSWTGSGAVSLRWEPTINMNAPFDIATDADMHILQGGYPIMNINDSLTKSGGSGLTSIDTAFNNSGSIAVNSGQLTLGAPNVIGSSSGEFTVAAGSTLTVRGNHTYDGSSSFSGTGGLVHEGGTAILQGNYALTGPLGVSFGTLQFPFSPTIANDVTLSGGTLELQSGATVTGNVIIDPGKLLAVGPVDIAGTMRLHGQGQIDGSGTVTVDGPFTWTGGIQLGIGETVANDGLLISGGNGKDLRERTLNLGAASSWTGAGALTLRWGPTININGSFDIATDADMQHLQGENPILNINGSLTKSAGSGETQIAAAISNAGSIAVSSGQLSLMKSYSQGTNGTLDVDIAGIADFDFFPVVQAATLDGTLNINLLGGYEPELGETFEILTAASVTGKFATVSGTSIDTGRKFEVIYGGNNVTLEVVAMSMDDAVY